MAIAWLQPWEPVGRATQRELDHCHAWEAQLRREVGPQHALFGQSALLIARRYDCDDALYQLADGRVAVVHLTWRQGMETDPQWPRAQIFRGIEDWALECMAPDAATWEGDVGGGD